MRYVVRVLLALGGNAMTAADGSATPEAQQTAIAGAMESVAGLIAAGHEVVITHGNGPQVGNLLVKNELAAAVVPPVPLDWCCLLYTSDAADDLLCVDLGGRRIIKKKK